MSSRRTSTFVRAYNRDAINAVRAHLGQFSEANLQKAADRALASMIRKVQPEAKRDIRARYGVKASALNGQFRTVQGKGRKGDPYLGLWASSRRIGLIEFQGRWGGRRTKGAVAQVRLGQQKTYQSAFITTIQGKKAIRHRPLDISTGKRVHRGPLKMLRGPSPFEMLLGEDMRNGALISKTLTTYYSAEIRRQMELLRSNK